MEILSKKEISRFHLHYQCIHHFISLAGVNKTVCLRWYTFQNTINRIEKKKKLTKTRAKHLTFCTHTFFRCCRCCCAHTYKNNLIKLNYKIMQNNYKFP